MWRAISSISPPARVAIASRSSAPAITSAPRIVTRSLLTGPLLRINYNKSAEKAKARPISQKLISGSLRRYATRPDNILPPPPPGSLLFLLLGGLLVAYWLAADGSEEAATFEIDWSTFKRDYLPYGQAHIEKIVVYPHSEYALIFLNRNLPGPHVRKINIGDATAFHERLVEAQNELGVEVWNRLPLSYSHPGYGSVLVSILPSLAILGLLFFIFTSSMGAMGSRGAGGPGGLFGVGKSKAKLYTSDMRPDMNFSKVAGLEEAKVEVMEFVEFLKNPKRFTDLGAKIPRGALLVGPPGTGKTLLAKATAGEAGVPFFSASGSDFMEMFVGVGPARVRDLFNKARQKAPCIIFIDEIDAIGRKREKSLKSSHDERENTLNQLLVEMDGFDTKAGVIVLAGTNRADILDSALTRPGRFDRTINIDPPDLRGRKEILMIYLKPLKLEDTDIEKIAEHIATLTPGMAGADLANVCNEGALIAARHNKTAIQVADLEAAIDRVVGGLEKKNKVLTPRDKMTVAYHEAGHAVAGWFLEHADPLLKVSIVPRGSAALGYAQYQPRDQYLHTPSQLLDQMCVMLGGRVAESLIFGTISTGAKDDLERVTKLAYDQVTRLGFNAALGNLSFKPNQSDYPQDRPYSEKTAQLIDEEVRKMISQAYSRTEALLKEHHDGLVKVAERLLNKEKIGKDDMVELLGERRWKERRTYQDLAYEDEKELKRKEEKEKEASHA